FIGAWRRARQRVRTELTERWPERAGDPLTPDLIDAIRDRLAASRAWKTIGDVFARLGLAHLVPAHAGELAPAIERVASMADSLRGLAAARPALAAIGAWLPEGPQTAASLAAWDRRVDDRLAMLAARDALRDAAAALAPWFPGLAVLPSAAELGELLAAWRRDAARVAEADGLLVRAGAALPAAGELLAAVAAACADRPASGWRSAVLGAWAAGWVARLEHEQPVLAGLGHGADDREIDRLAARLRELETERRELEIERTLARLDRAELLEVEAAAKHARRTPAQKAREDLLKEARKQRLLMPLRTFVRRFAPIGLLDVTPVWLLSPETMAILFPRQALFDLVVFDEASQCTVEAGLPVLLRARRVVIAGDEKQMPPSSYFALGGVDEDESLAGGVEADERHDTLRDLLTAESLLSLARPRVAHTGLAWHYRCRDEALIAFSNHAMYQGELLTIPSTAGTAAPSALHWVPVTGGTYQGGENTAEATRVVDVVDELLARSPRPSIGVVTFNLRQRKAVLDAIDARRAADEQFAARWTDASALPLDERPFVRNLEQVQGDERDVIVFSLGHAPQARFRGGAATGEVYVPARFGPLGQRGGERRLNVAISRARLACYLVSSFEPGQLTVSSSRNEGPRLFKHFLEFAHHHHHGRRLEAARVLELVRSHARVEAAGRHRLPVDGFTPLQTQLALALEAAGIPYELDVGASGFRIPIALLDPADPTRFALAVLLEDGTGGADPFDLHVHRPGVLRQRGWKVVTVSAASWLRRGVEVLAELEAQVPGCRGAVTGDVYVRHREAMARPLGPTGVTNPIPVPGRRPDASRSATPVDDEGAVDDRAAASGPVATSEPVAALPPWARDISDELFRAALLYLDGHGTLHEGELMGMVGGPRRARAFVGLLDGWRHTLPFAIEVSDLAGANVYKKVPRSAPAGAPQEAAPVTA
ncbi:MAG TPA: AAA domain-containing protein, partial [Kofleriaceae bacterium]|nr:AAA domain-containing protein [Kofleriaceae bacterium]